MRGYHVLQGSDENTILSNLDGVGSLKCLTNTANICLAAKALHPEIIIVYRSLVTNDGLRDGPSLIEWNNPDIYYASLRPHLVPGFDYYEFINEWSAPSPQIEADFNIRMLTLLERDGMRGLAFSFAPGQPSMLNWLEDIRVLQWIDQHPQHGIAVHQTGMLPDSVQTLPDSYIRNTYITQRLEYVDAYLEAIHGYDLHDFKGVIVVSEMGWTNYTAPDQVFSCDQVRAGIRVTESFYRNSGLVDFYNLWNFGSSGGHWIDLSQCLPLRVTYER